MQNKIENILLEKMSSEDAKNYAKKICETLSQIEFERFKKTRELEIKINHMQGRCPNCNSKYYFCLDEWGYTPYHLHCDTCHINIGANSRGKTEELLYEYHKKNTYIEYYGGEIKLLIEGGVEKINAE